MKKGFTLMELLVVITIISVISVSATISFSKIDNDTSTIELEKKYKDIIRAAIIYADLNDSVMQSLVSKNKAYLKLYNLVEENYVSSDLSNPVTGEDISTNDTVVLYIDESNGFSFLNACIIDIKEVGGGVDVSCVSNTYEVIKLVAIFEYLKVGLVSIIPLYLSAQNFDIEAISLVI